MVPLVLSNVWLMVNPRFLAPPRSTRNWASRGVLGERVWTEGDRGTFPAEFVGLVLNLIQAMQGVGVAIMLYGLVVLDPMVSVTGLSLTQVAKCCSSTAWSCCSRPSKTAPSTRAGTTDRIGDGSRPGNSPTSDPSRVTVCCAGRQLNGRRSTS